MDGWEKLRDSSMLTGVGIESARLKVPGGYIYRTVVTSGPFRDGASVHVEQTFVPNPPNGAGR